jgi:hypothetical protein
LSAIVILPSSLAQIATSPAALPEEFGPHEPATGARRLSAKEPLEQAPSVIDEPPVTDAAYALGITCTTDAATVVATTVNAAAMMVPVKIVFVLILIVFFIAILHEKLKKIVFNRKLCAFIEVIFYYHKDT